MAAADNINVFVKLDMKATKGICFNVPKNETVQSLIDRIKAREGPQVGDVRLIHRTKPMRVKNNQGGLCTLADYDCYDNCTMMASLRLLGGAQAEGVQFKSFNPKEVEKLGGTLAISGKADDGSTMYKNCDVYGSDGCSESGCPKASFGCACVICADCLGVHLQSLLNSGSLKLRCMSTGHRNDDVRPMLLYTIAAYTNEEKSAADVKLSSNYFARTDSDMHVCANDDCKYIIYREPANKSYKVQCTKCQKFTCWNCSKPHNGDVWCGNDACDPVAMVQQLIELGDTKKINNKDVWDTRLCPNPACAQVIGHYANCKHMTCKSCNTQYCHICLKLWGGDNGCSHGIDCQPVPKQTINKSDLPH